MATFSYYFITLFVAMFIPASSSHSCVDNIIPLADIHAAVEASFKAYENTKKGDQVGRYTVTAVYTATYRTQTILALVLDLDAQSTTMVAFQGTKTNEQLLQYVEDYFKTVSTRKGIMKLHGKEVRVDRDGKQVSKGGFRVEVIDYFLSGMGALLLKMKSHLSKANRKYIFTGHSLGGAMASTLALQRKLSLGHEWVHPESCLITFGQPRVGNGAFAAFHDAQISPHRKLRFIYNHDLVPHLPPRPFPRLPTQPPPLDRSGFLHHSREVYIRVIKKEKWWHFWVTESNFWKFCDLKDPKFHSSKCSNDDLLNYSYKKDHMAYRKMINRRPDEYIWFHDGDKGTTSWGAAWREACHNTKSKVYFV